MVQDADTLAAQVRGTQTYRVKLQAAGTRLKYDCSCSFASEGAFCKRGSFCALHRSARADQT